MPSSEFAQRLLEKHGWKKGAGLGKKEHGIAEPIKASLKFDKTGVGHDPGKEFTDHWWLRVFNDAAKQIGKVKETEVVKNEQTEKQNEMSERKKRFYAGFVKSSILSNGVEEKEEGAESNSDDDDDSTSGESLPTLDDLHKYCGGATGHRAAMWGIKMQGKLARVAAHDQMFKEKQKAQKLSSSSSVAESELAKVDKEDSLQKKNKRDKKNKHKDKVTVPNILSSSLELNESESGAPKKKHKKEKKRKAEIDSEECPNDDGKVKCAERVNERVTVVSEENSNQEENTKCKTKRGKKKKKSEFEGEISLNTNCGIDVNHENKRNKKKSIQNEETTDVTDTNAHMDYENAEKKSKRKRDKETGSCFVDGDKICKESRELVEAACISDIKETPEDANDTQPKSKKKKKKSKKDGYCLNPVEKDEDGKNTTKAEKQEQLEDIEHSKKCNDSEGHDTSISKKKKKRKQEPEEIVHGSNDKLTNSKDESHDCPHSEEHSKKKKKRKKDVSK